MGLNDDEDEDEKWLVLDNISSAYIFSVAGQTISEPTASDIIVHGVMQ